MKNKLFLGGIALVAPAIITPLVCATKVASTNSQVNEEKTELFHIGKNSSYTVQFDDTNKTCKLIRLSINEGIISKFQVPASCPRNGETGGGELYPLTELDCEGRHDSSNTISILDLSTASNLVTIKDNCFKRNNDLKINWVNFAGAYSLKTIGANAFQNQQFSSDYAPKTTNAVMDMSDTAITSIGENAFKGCCIGGKNNFSSIIFPETLQSIGKQAFYYDNGNTNTQMCFKHIFFNTQNPASATFLGDNCCLPQIADKVTPNSVVCPRDNISLYKALKNIAQIGTTHIDSSSVSENNIAFEASTSGSKTITTPSHMSGADNAEWIPWVRRGSIWEKKEGLTLTLSNDYNGVFKMNNGRLTWNSSIQEGVYKFTIQVSYQDTSYVVGMGISPVITVTVGEPTLSGGTGVLYAVTGVQGSDKNVWSLSMNGVAGGITEQTATLENIPDGWTQANFPVEVTSTGEGENIKFRIQWQQNPTRVFDTPGTYAFTLVVTGKTTLGITVTARRPIAIVVSNVSYDLVFYQGDSVAVTENRRIVLTQGQTSTDYTLRFCDAYGVETVIPEGISKPALSLDSSIGICSLVSRQVGIYTRWDLKITANVAPGTYTVYAQTTIPTTLSSGYTVDYPITTYEFTIVVEPPTGRGYNMDKVDMTGGTDIIGTTKLTAGSDTQKWVPTILNSDTNADEWLVSNITKEVAPWYKSSTTKLEMIKHVTPTLHDNQITITWDDELSTSDDWMEILEYNLIITLVSTTSNDERTIILPLAFYLTNIGEIQTNLPTLITTAPDTTGQVENHIELRLNGKVFRDDETVYQLETHTVEDAYHISGKYDKVTEHFIISWDNELSIGVHSFHIRAYNAKAFIEDIIPISIEVKNILELKDVPEIVFAETHYAGKHSTPIKVSFNNEEIAIKDQVTFNVVGAPVDCVWIDTDGYINWNEKLGAGIYNVLVYASYEGGGELTETLSMFQLSVKQVLTPAQKSTFIGATVGAAVGGLALGIGGTFAGKAIANKNKKGAKSK